MAKDPYSVLGVGRNATDDEIKKAYRELARKYHPDNYAGNPLADLVEEKMKEVNEAYDAIQKERANASSSSSSGRYSSYTGSGITSFEEARRLIKEGRYSEAELIIDSTPAGDRGAEWNYLKGLLLAQRGRYYDAQRYIETACYYDPNNAEYRAARERMYSQGTSFGSPYRQSNGGGDTDCCGICTTFLCMDALCNCCGGGC